MSKEDRDDRAGRADSGRRDLSPERLIHELEVHQIELEQQNHELEQTRAELEAALARYTDLYELAPVGYFSLGADGTVHRANLTAARLLGIDRGELVGRRFPGYLEPASRPPFARFLAELCQGRADAPCEVLVPVSGKPPLTLELTGASRGSDGECRVVAADLTARKHAEAEKRELEIALAQADRLATMGVLAGGIAHELNNPLTYLLHHTESLAIDVPRLTEAVSHWSAAVEQRLGDAAFAEVVGAGAALLRPAFLADTALKTREALEGARRIEEISRAFSAFWRPERASLGPADVVRAIRSAARLAGAELKYRAQLRDELAPTPPVWASEGKLAQVFLNLLLNAAQAIDEGKADQNSVTLRTWPEGSEVFAEVSDTGAGIPASDLERIFDPFFTTKSAGTGTGLGLALCKSLLADVGGAIRVESVLGRGTRVVVRLPALDAQPAKPAPERVGAPAAEGDASRGRVLVIDDEAPIRRLLERLIAKRHDVVTAASGQAACELLERDCEFDVILCDLMMPTMTGMELHAWVAARTPALAERVVFCTGGAFTAKASEYLGRLPNPVVPKPLEAERLMQLLAEGVSASRRGGSPSW